MSGSGNWVAQKWRPALWMVVFGVVLSVSLLPLIGLCAVMAYEMISGHTFALRSVEGMVLLAVGSLLVAAVVGWVFLRTLLLPILALEERTAEIDGGGEEAFYKIDQGGTREVALLANRFFGLARKLSDRSAYLSLFTMHVGHELKTPLTSIQGAAELMCQEGDRMNPAQRQRFLGNILEDTERLKILTDKLAELARADRSELGGHCDGQHVFENVCGSEGIRLDWRGDDAPLVAMSEENLSIVALQLVRNAKEQGASIFHASAVYGDGSVILSVGDDGAALSEANRDQVLEAFFTTRRSDGGTGMGLTIASNLLQRQGGGLTLASSDGAKFSLNLPKAEGGKT